MKEQQIEDRIEYISTLYKQNLNGRESEDEIFKEGIRAGIEETEEIMYSEEEVESIYIEMVNWAIDNIDNPNAKSGEKFEQVIKKFKNK